MVGVGETFEPALAERALPLEEILRSQVEGSCFEFFSWAKKGDTVVFDSDGITCFWVAGEGPAFSCTDFKRAESPQFNDSVLK